MGGAYGLHGISDKIHALADNPSSRLVFKFIAPLAFQARSQNCDKRLLASSCLSTCPSVHMEQLGSHWTDFHEIWYLSIFRKSVVKIQDWLKSDINNEYFGDDINTFMIMCRWMLLLYKGNLSYKGCTELQNTHFMFNFLFPKTVSFMR